MERSTTARNQPRAYYVSPIVEAGKAACRLYGVSKTNVADIARLLGKSPASVYKVFPSKVAILDAIAASFLETYFCFTKSTEDGRISATDRLKETALEQHRLLLRARSQDRHMFDLIALAAESDWPSFKEHLKRFQAAVEGLIRAGIATAEFAPVNIESAVSCFCSSIRVVWDPRIVEALPSSQCGASAPELVSFALAAFRLSGDGK